MDKPGTSSSSTNASNIDIIELGSDDEDDIYPAQAAKVAEEDFLYMGHGSIDFGSNLREEKSIATLKLNKDFNLVDASHELVDPNPNIHDLFVNFDHQFFWSTLTSRACVVEWSKTMTRYKQTLLNPLIPKILSCAGICRFNVGNGLCCIRLSEPLLKLRPRKDLVETLLVIIFYVSIFREFFPPLNLLHTYGL